MPSDGHSVFDRVPALTTYVATSKRLSFRLLACGIAPSHCRAQECVLWSGEHPCTACKSRVSQRSPLRSESCWFS